MSKEYVNRILAEINKMLEEIERKRKETVKPFDNVSRAHLFGQEKALLELKIWIRDNAGFEIILAEINKNA